MPPPIRNQRRTEEHAFWQSLTRFVSHAQHHVTTFDLNVAEMYHRQVSEMCETIHVMSLRAYEIDHDHHPSAPALATSIESLLVKFSEFQERFSSRVEFLQNHDLTPTEGPCISATPTLTGRVGRPRLCINVRIIQSLRDLSFSWVSIATMFGISARTLRNRRQHDQDFQDLDVGFSSLADDELDTILSEIMRISQRSGETLMIGALRARGKNCL